MIDYRLIEIAFVGYSSQIEAEVSFVEGTKCGERRSEQTYDDITRIVTVHPSDSPRH